MQRGEALPNWLLEYLIETAGKGPPSKRRGPDNRLRTLDCRGCRGRVPVDEAAWSHNMPSMALGLLMVSEALRQMDSHLS